MSPPNTLDIPPNRCPKNACVSNEGAALLVSPRPLLNLAGGQPVGRIREREPGFSTAAINAYLPGQEGRRGRTEACGRHPPSLQEAKKSANRREAESPRRQKQVKGLKRLHK